MKTSGNKKHLLAKADECVWMKAGVVNKKFCTKEFNCSECTYDVALTRIAHENKIRKTAGKRLEGKRQNIVFWEDKIKSLPAGRQPCLHYMKGRINFRTCTNEYSCGSCEFDQYFLDQYAVHASVKPVDVLDIEGFKIPQGFYFHKGHTWIKVEEGSEVRIGLDDFAAKVFGPMDRIEAPLMGKEIKQGRKDISIKRGENTAQLISPVSGVVVEINSRLRNQGEPAGMDPYSDGWVARIHSDNLREDLKNLMMGDETSSFMKKESHRLHDVIEEAVPLAADGGFVAEDVVGSIPEIGWEKLVNLFLDRK
jgi:glycine cleavage system H lipoate-binding protein